MLVRKFGSASAAGCSGHKADLEKIRFVNVLESTGVFSDCCGQRVEPDGASVV